LQKCHAVEWPEHDHGAETLHGASHLSLPRMKQMTIGGPVVAWCRNRHVSQHSTPANPPRKFSAPRHLAFSIVGIARGRPELTVEVLMPRPTQDSRDHWAYPYDEVNSLRNMTILHAWDDLAERNHNEDHGQ